MAQQNIDECLAELHGSEIELEYKLVSIVKVFCSNTLFKFRNYPPRTIIVVLSYVFKFS